MAPCDLTAATTTLGIPQLQLCTLKGLTVVGGAPCPIEVPRPRFPNGTHLQYVHSFRIRNIV